MWLVAPEYRRSSGPERTDSDMSRHSTRDQIPSGASRAMSRQVEYTRCCCVASTDGNRRSCDIGCIHACTVTPAAAGRTRSSPRESV